MPSVDLRAAAGGVHIAYTDEGAGPAVVFLHGGWGAALYPVTAQAAALAGRARLLVPTRSGYGRSTPLTEFAPGFHERAAAETLAVLDALGIGRAVLWGHSDGAVIAAHAALQAPGRVAGVVLEALHLYGDKPGSHRFFADTAEDPDWVGERAAAILAGEHGADRWRGVLRMNARAWLDLRRRLPRPADLYGGRLGAIDGAGAGRARARGPAHGAGRARRHLRRPPDRASRAAGGSRTQPAQRAGRRRRGGAGAGRVRGRGHGLRPSDRRVVRERGISRHSARLPSAPATPEAHASRGRAALTQACRRARHARCQETGTPREMHGGEGERQAGDRRRVGGPAKPEGGDGQPADVGGARRCQQEPAATRAGRDEARPETTTSAGGAIHRTLNESGCRSSDRKRQYPYWKYCRASARGLSRTHQSKTTAGSSRSRPPARR